MSPARPWQVRVVGLGLITLVVLALLHACELRDDLEHTQQAMDRLADIVEQQDAVLAVDRHYLGEAAATLRQARLLLAQQSATLERLARTCGTDAHTALRP